MARKVINPDLSVRVAFDPEHVHLDGSRYKMGGEIEDEALLERRSDELSIARQSFVCLDCFERVEMMATISREMEGVRQYQAVAEAAALGHVPPDHGWDDDEHPGCDLCAALDALAG